ncbi:MAG TPA: hypothetical protein VGP80_11080 [Gemmatimonadales bacterium]|nr:hypothetical protein [Gemmatimonadales bacterium]
MTLRCALATFAITLIAASALPAQSAPPVKKSRGFQLFNVSSRHLLTNRVDCWVDTEIQLCGQDPGIDGIVGGLWPKGTFNNYMFNSGLQLAGIIGSDGGPWAGDTTGVFFFDPRGTSSEGEEVQPIVYRGNAADAAAWPDAAKVSGSLYHPSLVGSVSASEGDAWWLSWDGNPDLIQGRPHPLGIAVEGRALTWNYPVGNDDIVYFAFTYYNITSLNPADYAAVRPELRPILLDLANRFHTLNDTKFGITLQASGYTVDSLFTGIAADPDVGDAAVNYSSVNVPFSLGFAYGSSFPPFQGWTFDPIIFSTPFFAGTGFVGIASLKPSSGSAGFRLYSNLGGGGGDPGPPRDVAQLHRYLSGAISLQLDGACNFVQLVDHICFIRSTSPSDTRMFQSTGPFVLGPGESVSQVVAYIFAAPVGPNPNCGSSPDCVPPGNFNIIRGLGDPAIVAGGVNRIDSIAGFLGAADASGDGVLQGDEFVSVPRSLYGKAQLAQAIFDHQFLLPSAPAAPEFFLIPGDNQVSVIWRPTTSEQTGEPFFNITKDPQVMNAQGVLVGNPLYDPNFRQFDVEGYRVYRGRVDDPGALTMVASFDYAGTVISDYSGQVNPTRLCAPELGISTDCPAAFDPIQPGVGRTVHVDIPLAGQVVQVRLGDRIPLTDNSALTLRADTTFAPVLDSPNCLCDTGVPFVFVDNGVRNNFRYFYSVAAFDVNSVESGPASLESPRILKSVTPVRPASNFQNTAVVTQAVFGRGVARTDSLFPGLDPATGMFSKVMPASSGWQLQLISFVKEVVGATDSIVIRLDSMVLGSAYEVIPNQYWTTVTTAADTMVLLVPLVQHVDNTPAQFSQSFTAITLDPGLAARFGGNGTFTLSAQFEADMAGNYYTNAFGRGCTNSAPGFSGGNGCDYNGARWFDGPSPANNETQAHPNACAAQVNTLNFVTCYSNAGALTGVAVIHEVKSYITTPNVWRNVEGVLGGAVRSADYNMYWGTGGVVDSVIDVSNNVGVPFDTDLREGASWGILNQSAAQAFGSYDQRVELTINDFGCVPPFTTFAAPVNELGCAPGTIYQLSNTAIPGPIVFWSGPTTNARPGCTIGVGGCGAVAPNQGFAMYLAGHLFMFELAGGQVPARGTVWSMRDYIGAIRGGGDNCVQCTAGSDGPYVFSGFPAPRTFAAVGAELRLRYDVTNQLNSPTRDDLAQVHTVPDPYYLRNDFEADAGQQVIKFVNLPADAIIRVYSSSGVLVTLLEHHSQTFGGAEDWDVRNRTRRRVASGLYFYHIEAGSAGRVGRLTIINDRPGF